MRPGFALWLTGLPAAGKSTLAAALAAELSGRGVNLVVLESDVVRRVLTPRPRYDEEEREVFYGALAYITQLLTEHGVSVLIDGTAHRRSYRDRARQQIPRFAEIYVDCPQAVCIERDPKGIYRQAREGKSASVPGLQVPYEPPERPAAVVRSAEETPADAARRVIASLPAGWIEMGRRSSPAAPAGK